ncbi:MAG: glycosyltransferase family 4 protein [Sedimentisphaerales bacterium]|nr:glycosyltransferase family 4 protein [Sedimentisphaerales bacterium]
MDIIFWQIMPSHHQSGVMRYLAGTWNRQVHAVFDFKMLPEREKLGWRTPDLGNINMHFLEDKNTPEKFVSDFIREHRDAIHVLSGFRGCRSVELAWTNLRQHPKSHLAVIAERPNMLSWKSHFKKLWYKNFIEKYKNRFKAILSMGTLGVKWFRGIGCPDDILFPYIYQYDSTAGKQNTKKTEVCRNNVKFIYAGQFIRRKGCDLLLKATHMLPSKGWCLDLVGDGYELGNYINAFIDSNKLPIRYIGKWNSGEVVSRLKEYDVCIVPSRHDGWGMVVNEAIEAGLGVIVSNRTGASDLVEASGAGIVVPADNPMALSEAMQSVINNPELALLWRKLATEFSPRICASSVGSYLHNVLTYSFLSHDIKKPEAPWFIIP